MSVSKSEYASISRIELPFKSYSVIFWFQILAPWEGGFRSVLDGKSADIVVFDEYRPNPRAAAIETFPLGSRTLIVI